MTQSKLTLFYWFAHGKANHCHKFTKLKCEDTKCKYGRPYWIWIRLLFWQLETSGEDMEVDKQLKFKTHKRMQVEFISNNVGVMTHGCLSSLALAYVSVQCTELVSCVSLVTVYGIVSCTCIQCSVTTVTKYPISSSKIYLIIREYENKYKIH